MQPGGAYLVALIPPGSVEAEMGKVQAALFAEHGLASAQALPPLIPVAFIPEVPARGFLADLERSVHAGWRARVAGHAWVEGWLFILADTGGLWAGLRARALAAAGGAPRGPFPAAEGFCLGCADAEPERRPRITPTPPELSFSSCALAIMRFESPRDEWWRELYWETLEEKPLRGRRET
jgi:hypothetical protein